LDDSVTRPKIWRHAYVDATESSIAKRSKPMSPAPPGILLASVTELLPDDNPNCEGYRCDQGGVPYLSPLLSLSLPLYCVYSVHRPLSFFFFARAGDCNYTPYLPASSISFSVTSPLACSVAGPSEVESFAWRGYRRRGRKPTVAIHVDV
jgi:hypothetical protein